MFASRFAPQLVILGVLVVSRLLTGAMGLAPDPDVVVGHWQHADLRFLAADPIGTLMALHTQPPLWNGILAAVVAFTGPDAGAATAAVYGLNLMMTAAIGLMFLDILCRFGFSRTAATVFTAVSLLSPNILYFETYIFYPHFTAFLVTLLMWLLMQVKRGGALWPAAGALAVLAALALTWAIFHPAFVALAGVALVWWSRGLTLASSARPVIAMAALSVIVAALPSVKNFAVYGIPSASTWMGLNIAQTIPGGQRGEFAQCDFDTAHGIAIANASPVAGHPALTHAWKSPGVPNMIHAGMIPISQRCLGLMKDVILKDPLSWLGSRIGVVLGSHQLPPSNYIADPLGWDAMFGPAERLTDSFGQVSRITMTLWYLLLLWAGARMVGANPPFYLALFGLIAYFTLASHVLNGGEQARMRYTIEPVYLLFSAGLLAMLGRRFGSLLRRRRETFVPAE